MPFKKKKLKDILVKVGRIGSSTMEVALNGERTVPAALKAAGLNKKDSEVVQVNGEEVSSWEDYELEDGNRVILVKNVKGGRI